MFASCLKTLEEYGYKNDREIDHFYKSNENKIIKNELYYRTISEGLFMLFHGESQLNPLFEEKGIMLDVARGPVNKIENLKEQICQFALQGYSYLQLYTEDVIDVEIKNFGYMRGKYSSDEIKEIVKFAKQFEIEIIPCIQTLGHLEHFAKWDVENEIFDTRSILNVKNNKAIEIIKKVIDFCKENFDSTKIHVGMDEAVELGTGTFITNELQQKQSEIYLNHLKFVYEYCLECGYEEVIIWSDMLFSINHASKYLYNNEINKQLCNEIREYEKLKLCFWNYGNTPYDKQINLIESHFDFTNDAKIICAGGVNQWSKIAYSPTMFNGFENFARAAHKLKQENFMLTIWFDDGGYNDYNVTKYGIYCRTCVLNNVKFNNDFFKKLYNLNIDDLLIICDFMDKFEDSTMLLWEDPIEQLYSRTKEVNHKLLSRYWFDFNKNDDLAYCKTLINFIIKKSQIQNKIRNNNMLTTDEVKDVITMCDEVKMLFRKNWDQMFKINARDVIIARFEVLKLRFEIILNIIENGEEFHSYEYKDNILVLDSFKYINFGSRMNW